MVEGRDMDEKFESKAREIEARARDERAQGQDTLVKRALREVLVTERLAAFTLYVVPNLRSAVAAAQAQVLKGVGQLDYGEASDGKWHCTFTPSSRTFRKSEMVVALNVDTGRVRVSMTLGRAYPTNEDLGAIGDIVSAAIHAVVREFAIEAVHAA